MSVRMSKVWIWEWEQKYRWDKMNIKIRVPIIIPLWAPPEYLGYRADWASLVSWHVHLDEIKWGAWSRFLPWGQCLLLAFLGTWDKKIYMWNTGVSKVGMMTSMWLRWGYVGGSERNKNPSCLDGLTPRSQKESCSSMMSVCKLTDGRQCGRAAMVRLLVSEVYHSLT